MNELNKLMMWVPVISTLVGTLIGFGATFIGITYSKNREEKTLKEQRDRERVEKIYELLINIRSNSIKDMGNIINWIHSAVKIQNDEMEEVPPLIALEMYINLYYPELEQQRLMLMGKIDKYSQLYFDCRFKNYSHEKLEVKQNEAGDMVRLSREVEQEIKVFQKCLTNKAKA